MVIMPSVATTASALVADDKLCGQPEQKVAQEEHQVLEQRQRQHGIAQKLDGKILQPVVEGRLRIVADRKPLGEEELLAFVELERGRRR